MNRLLPETPWDHADPDLSIILPCYRAAALARRSVCELTDVLSSGRWSWEIVVVDDGGGDFPEDPWIEDPRVHLLRLAQNQGKGGAVRAGMLAARGRVRAFTDVDLPYDPQIFDLIAEYVLHRGFHMVVGDRTLPESRYALDVGWRRRLASAVFSSFVGHLVTGGFFDTQCGLKGMRGDVAEAIFGLTRIQRFAFDVELLYLALVYRLDIKRVPVVLRNNETSSVRLLRDSARMLADVLLIKYHKTCRHYDHVELARLVTSDFTKDRVALAAHVKPTAVAAD